MKTHIAYQCDVCGRRSEDKAVIEQCEAQGSKAEFAKNQQVRVRFDHSCSWVKQQHGLTVEVNYEGVIRKVVFSKGDHTVTYEVRIENRLVYGVPPMYIQALPSK